MPILAAATAVHRLADADAAPGFVAAYAALRAYGGVDTLIGQTVAFDMAVIATECARAGLPYRPLPALDTGLEVPICGTRSRTSICRLTIMAHH